MLMPESRKNKIKNNKQCSIIFHNKTCLNNNLLPKYTLFKIYTYIYIYIYIYIYKLLDGIGKLAIFLLDLVDRILNIKNE